MAEEGAKPGMLSPADRATIEALMVQEGDVMKAPKDFSDAVKSEIAKKVIMKTRTERDAEELAAISR